MAKKKFNETTTLDIDEERKILFENLPTPFNQLPDEMIKKICHFIPYDQGLHHFRQSCKGVDNYFRQLKEDKNLQEATELNPSNWKKRLSNSNVLDKIASASTIMTQLVVLFNVIELLKNWFQNKKDIYQAVSLSIGIKVLLFFSDSRQIKLSFLEELTIFAKPIQDNIAHVNALRNAVKKNGFR